MHDDLIKRIEAADPWLWPYFDGWAGLADPEPWGAAMSFALEVASGYGLIRGESDATLTATGQALKALRARGGSHE